MNMVREYHNGLNGKGSFLHNSFKHITKFLNILLIGKNGPPFLCHDRKKINTPFVVYPSVIGHGSNSVTMGFVPLNPSYDSSDMEVGWVERSETHHIHFRHFFSYNPNAPNSLSGRPALLSSSCPIFSRSEPTRYARPETC